jgi:hypothetical protein
MEAQAFTQPKHDNPGCIPMYKEVISFHVILGHRHGPDHPSTPQKIASSNSTQIWRPPFVDHLAETHGFPNQNYW